MKNFELKLDLEQTLDHNPFTFLISVSNLLSFSNFFFVLELTFVLELHNVVF